MLESDIDLRNMKTKYTMMFSRNNIKSPTTNRDGEIEIRENNHLEDLELLSRSDDEARRIHSNTADQQSEKEKAIETLSKIDQIRNSGDRGHTQWLCGRDAWFISGERLGSWNKK